MSAQTETDSETSNNPIARAGRRRKSAMHQSFVFRGMDTRSPNEEVVFEDEEPEAVMKGVDKIDIIDMTFPEEEVVFDQECEEGSDYDSDDDDGDDDSFPGTPPLLHDEGPSPGVVPLALEKAFCSDDGTNNILLTPIKKIGRASSRVDVDHEDNDDNDDDVPALRESILSEDEMPTPKKTVSSNKRVHFAPHVLQRELELESQSPKLVDQGGAASKKSFKPTNKSTTTKKATTTRKRPKWIYYMALLLPFLGLTLLLWAWWFLSTSSSSPSPIGWLLLQSTMGSSSATEILPSSQSKLHKKLAQERQEQEELEKHIIKRTEELERQKHGEQQHHHQQHLELEKQRERKEKKERLLLEEQRIEQQERLERQRSLEQEHLETKLLKVQERRLEQELLEKEKHQERVAQEQEARRRKADEEAKQAQEEVKQREEEKVRLKAEAAEALRKTHEAAKVKAEEEANLVQEEAKQREEEKVHLKAEATEALRKTHEAAKLKAEEEANLALEEAIQREEEKVRLKAEAAEALRKTHEEARLKAEEDDARLQAEEEAKRLTDESSRRKAAREAQLKAEEDVRLETEEQATRQADEEARRKAAEKARLKAEEDARPVAEEKVKRQAEEDARRQAEEATLNTKNEEARQEAEEEAIMRDAEEAWLKAADEARVKASVQLEDSLETQAETAHIGAVQHAGASIDEHIDRESDAKIHDDMHSHVVESLLADVTNEIGVGVDYMKDGERDDEELSEASKVHEVDIRALGSDGSYIDTPVRVSEATDAVQAQESKHTNKEKAALVDTSDEPHVAGQNTSWFTALAPLSKVPQRVEMTWTDGSQLMKGLLIAPLGSSFGNVNSALRHSLDKIGGSVTRAKNHTLVARLGPKVQSAIRRGFQDLFSCLQLYFRYFQRAFETIAKLIEIELQEEILGESGLSFPATLPRNNPQSSHSSLSMAAATRNLAHMRSMIQSYLNHMGAIANEMASTQAKIYGSFNHIGDDKSLHEVGEIFGSVRSSVMQTVRSAANAGSSTIQNSLGQIDDLAYANAKIYGSLNNIGDHDSLSHVGEMLGSAKDRAVRTVRTAANVGSTKIHNSLNQVGGGVVHTIRTAADVASSTLHTSLEHTNEMAETNAKIQDSINRIGDHESFIVIANILAKAREKALRTLSRTFQATTNEGSIKAIQFANEASRSIKGLETFLAALSISLRRRLSSTLKHTKQFERLVEDKARKLLYKIQTSARLVPGKAVERVESIRKVWSDFENKAIGNVKPTHETATGHRYIER
jgi:hypothetical protein